jgi:isopenicillin N synthase-like dioxygenase
VTARGDHVPLIDVAALRRDAAGAAAADTVAAIDAACTDTGFFVITGHGVDRPVADVFAAARSFFALADDVKAASAMVGVDGYLPVGSARSGAKEMFDVGQRGFARWPTQGGFRAALEAYQRAALALAGDLLRALAIALDVAPTFFADRMHDPQCFLRLIHAPARPHADDETTGAHTDYGAITLLATDGVPGLEVRPGGGDWMPVEAPSGSLVVNLGDMLARWTNLRYASTPHRVVPVADEPRYSVPFFVNPDAATRVACIPSCVDAAHPCRFAPITAGEFLQGRIDGTIPTGDGTHR